MAIRKRERKNRSGYCWEVYFNYKTPSGVTKRYSKSGFETKQQAKDHEALKRAEYVKNSDIVTNSKKTFNQVFEEYMNVEGRGLYASSTWHYYNNTHKLYVKDTLIANEEIFKIRYKDLQRFFTDMRSLGQATLKNMKKVFNVTFKYALKNEYITANPMNMVIARSENNDCKRETFELTQQQFSELCMRIVQVDKYTPNPEEAEWSNFNYLVDNM